MDQHGLSCQIILFDFFFRGLILTEVVLEILVPSFSDVELSLSSESFVPLAASQSVTFGEGIVLVDIAELNLAVFLFLLFVFAGA